MAATHTADAEIDQWRDELRELFAWILGWLSEKAIRESGDELELPPSIQSHSILLNEEQSGPYETEELILTHMGRSMKVRPVARWTLMADGRVDLIGSAGPFILVNLREAGGWHLVPDSPTEDLRPLTAPLFRELVAACLL